MFHQSPSMNYSALVRILGHQILMKVQNLIYKWKETESLTGHWVMTKKHFMIYNSVRRNKKNMRSSTIIFSYPMNPYHVKTSVIGIRSKSYKSSMYNLVRNSLIPMFALQNIWNLNLKLRRVTKEPITKYMGTSKTNLKSHSVMLVLQKISWDWNIKQINSKILC